MTARVLVAGIGNIFLGDDGFGSEVAQRLIRRPRPEGVRIVDYGIRGFDLAYAMLDDHDVCVLIDALPRSAPPGTLSVLEADTDVGDGAAEVQGHVMNPTAVLHLVAALGGKPRRVLVVGCEPESFGPEELGRMGLSDTVAGVVDDAVALVERVVADVLRNASVGADGAGRTVGRVDDDLVAVGGGGPGGPVAGGNPVRDVGHPTLPADPVDVTAGDARA